MIQICKNCGAVNSEAVTRCYFCDEPFNETEEVPTARATADGAATRATSAPTNGNLAVQPANWREELASRVEAYRERRRQLISDDSQTDLPFHEEEESEEAATMPRRGPLLTPGGIGPQMYRSLPLSRQAGPRAQGVERVEIAVTQPELDFTGRETRPGGASAEAGRVIPVASLRERRNAGLLDGIFLLLAYAGFLGVFRAFGGRILLGKADAIVTAATLALFYAQYFALFTVFGGETPGMLLRRLRVVSFDGGEPTSRQLFWRGFGYLISGGTALLGFLWALWDEDHLTWQDRISQTYLTVVRPEESPEAARVALPEGH